MDSIVGSALYLLCGVEVFLSCGIFEEGLAHFHFAVPMSVKHSGWIEGRLSILGSTKISYYRLC